MPVSTTTDAREAASRFRTLYTDIATEIQRLIVGQQEIVDGAITALLAGGHVLLEGVPGLGKTMLVRCLSGALHASFSRIQFTPDMMPADILGTWVLMESAQGHHDLRFQEGPLIANLVLADEINRATPKTQSALLEAMQERQITVGRRTIVLEEPFCVLATQNPIEQEGTYPLPEAQLDRFLMKLVVRYPREEDYFAILDRTTADADIRIAAVTDAAEVVRMRQVARAVPVPDHAKQHAIRLVMATQPGSAHATKAVNDYVALGASPRGAQALLLAAKVRALVNGRFAVNGQDVREVALPVLRHRLVLNFHAQSAGVTDQDIVSGVLAHISEPLEATS